MEFKNYWYGQLKPGAEREGFAKRVAKSVGYLNLVAGGFRMAGESLAMLIERESNREVTAEEVRPDVPWHVVRDSGAVQKVAG